MLNKKKNIIKELRVEQKMESKAQIRFAKYLCSKTKKIAYHAEFTNRNALGKYTQYDRTLTLRYD